MQQGPSPAAALAFERALAELLREAGREVAQFAYNQSEPERSEQLPHYLEYEAGQYRRMNRKTPNREVATLFGKITLRRHGYRYVERDVAEPAIFPLEVQLGLAEGATPALADQAARALAETGATQQTVLVRLKREHGVVWGVKKLRAVAEKTSAAMEPCRREQQAVQVVEWLRQAQDSKGRNRPVLAAGRDGITLCTQPHSFTVMGEALFGPGRAAAAWAARMRKLLMKPNGPFRVLHAAAAMRSRRNLSARARKDFQRAYNDICTRTKHMQYAEFRRQGLPIGSGITEAACKTVFTQRLKLSGMRWSRGGAQTILNLRVVLLSGLWDKVYQAAVNATLPLLRRTPEASTSKCRRNAA